MNHRLEIMESASAGKALAYLGLPTTVGLSVTGFCQLTVSFLAVKMGTQAMEAISIVYPSILIMPGIRLLFGSGGAAYMAELLGAGEKEKAETVLASTVLYCILFSTMTQLLLPVTPVLLVHMGASSRVLPLAVQYGQIPVISFLFHIPSVCMNNPVQAGGNTSLSMIPQMIGTALNVVLTSIFLFGFGWGTRGAAASAAMAQFTAFRILAQYYLCGRSYLKLDSRKVRPQWWILEPTLKTGVPLLCANLLQSISMAVADIAATPYGNAVVAGFGTVNRAIGMTTLAVTGLSRGYQTFISYRCGAGRPGRIRQATRTAYLWGMLDGLVVATVQTSFSGGTVSAFPGDAEVISAGAQALVVGSLLFFTYGFQPTATMYLLCIRYSKADFVLSIFQQGLAFLPLLFLFDRLFAVTGILYTQTVADLVTTALLLLFLGVTKRNRTAVLAQVAEKAA